MHNTITTKWSTIREGRSHPDSRGTWHFVAGHRHRLALPPSLSDAPACKVRMVSGKIENSMMHNGDVPRTLSPTDKPSPLPARLRSDVRAAALSARRTSALSTQRDPAPPTVHDCMAQHKVLPAAVECGATTHYAIWARQLRTNAKDCWSAERLSRS